MTYHHIEYLRDLSKKIFPKAVAEIVLSTPKPFIQAVFDFQLPTYSNNQFIFVGDAAVTLRPHSASGVLKSLNDAIKLFEIFRKNLDRGFENTVSEWKKYQTIMACEEIEKAKSMGEALVTNHPNWSEMNHDNTEKWWSGVMRNKTWYATNSAMNTLFYNKETELNEPKLKFTSKL